MEGNLEDENKEAGLAQPRPADPMAKARAAKAQKAAEKAEADLNASIAEASSASQGQPTSSKLKGRSEVKNPGGPMVRMKITSEGRNHISTGGIGGFERWERRAIVTLPEESAYSNWRKRYAEPEDDAVLDRFDARKDQEARAEARAKRRFDEVLERGVGAGEVYRSDPVGPGGAPAVL